MGVSLEGKHKYSKVADYIEMVQELSIPSFHQVVGSKERGKYYVTRSSLRRWEYMMASVWLLPEVRVRE